MPSDRSVASSQVVTVVRQDRRPRADLRGAHRRVSVGADLVIEPPAPDPLADRREHRLAGIDRRAEADRVAVEIAQHRGPIAALEQVDSQPGDRADRLFLDERIEVERGGRLGRQAEPQLVGEDVVGKPDAEPAALGSLAGLRRLAGPHRRWHPALARQGAAELAVRGIDEQAQRAADVRLASAVAAGDHREGPSGITRSHSERYPANASVWST